jgi:wyosine [tRNA(Phe)-imidazoG37] synthetase (radical SAM superfamily)
MKICLTIIVTKPDTAKFFVEVQPEKNNSITEWIKTLPGFVNFTDEQLSPTVKEQKITFDSIENYANYLEEITRHPVSIERVWYNGANSIRVSKTEAIV